MLKVACSRERNNKYGCSRPEAPQRVALGCSKPLQRIVQSRTATEDRGMKHLLNGVAIAAALAIAAPAAWAQAPMTPKSSAPKAAAPAAAPTAGAPTAPMASKQRHKRGGKHYARRGRGGPAMSMTDQLNREELARIQSGGAAMPPSQGIPGQPSELRGIPGAGQPSASEHPGQPR